MKKGKRLNEHRLWMIETIVQQKRLLQRLRRRKNSISGKAIEQSELLYAELLKEWNSLFTNPISGN